MYFLSIYCFETVTFVILYFSFIIVIQILKLLLSRKTVVILYFPSHRASLYTSVALQSFIWQFYLMSAVQVVRYETI